MKKLLILPLLILTACSSGKVLVTDKEYVVIEPSAEMYNCPQLSKEQVPEKDIYNQSEAASLIALLQRNNELCKNSLDSIKIFVEESKKRYKKQ